MQTFTCVWSLRCRLHKKDEWLVDPLLVSLLKHASSSPHRLAAAMATAGERNITLLMRFGYQIGDGKNLVEHFGHRLRYEMLEDQKDSRLLGSEQGLRTPEVRHLIFTTFCMVWNFHQAARLQHLTKKWA